MPAISGQSAILELQRREWRNTVGQSGMTPTAFAFLIPVFVVVVFAPFLCVFCIRKRRQTVPPVRKVKKPALRRAEARERLKLVTDVSNVTNEPKVPHIGTTEQREQAAVVGDASSISERECAICLSTLHAPSPPEPALLSSQSTVDEAATRPPSIHDPANPTSEPESILKLHVCGHEFHAECLVSWFVLRKTSCPICRALYISKEDMQTYEDEEAAIVAPQQMTVDDTATAQGRRDVNGVPISNWRYFWAGESVWNRENPTANGSQGATTQQPRPSRWGRFWRDRR